MPAPQGHDIDALQCQREGRLACTVAPYLGHDRAGGADAPGAGLVKHPVGLAVTPVDGDESARIEHDADAIATTIAQRILGRQTT